MGYYGTTFNAVCTTPVNVSSFVKPDATSPYGVVQSGVGDTAIGVTGSAANGPPGTPFAVPAVAASAGQSVVIYTAGSLIEVQIGAVAVVPGFVKPDANGLAIQAGGTDIATALVFAPAVPGAFILCQVLQMTNSANTTGVVSTAVNYTVTAANAGETIFLITNPDLTVTLPLASVAPLGMTLKVITGVVAGGTVGSEVLMASGDQLTGNGFTAAPNKGAVNTHATAVIGDYIIVQNMGVVGGVGTWNVVSVGGASGTSIWARQA